MNFISQSIRCNYFEWEDVELDDYYKNYIITRWETERVLTRENEQLTLAVKELEVEVQNQKKIVENLEKVEKKQNKELLVAYEELGVLRKNLAKGGTVEAVDDTFDQAWTVSGNFAKGGTVQAVDDTFEQAWTVGGNNSGSVTEKTGNGKLNWIALCLAIFVLFVAVVLWILLN